MKKVVVAAFAAGLFVSGCATPKTMPLDAAKLSAMNNQTIARTDRELPPFSAMKSSTIAMGALFGAVGGAAAGIAAINEGGIIVRLNAVEDPADAIAAALTEKLAMSGSARIADTIVIPPKMKANQIAGAMAGAQYVVDVQTTSWGTIYYAADWSHYGVSYGAMLRLIETSSNTVIAQSFCYVGPTKTPGVDAPTYDQMVADGATRLKALLKEAGQTCIAKFTTEALVL